MKSQGYLLKRLAALFHVGIFCGKGNELTCFSENPEMNPVYACDNLRKKLKRNADMQEEPYIYVDEYMVHFVCVKNESQYFFLGPMSLEFLSRIHLHQYYKRYGMEEDIEKSLKRFSFTEILNITAMLANIVSGVEYDDETLIYSNHMVINNKKQEEREKIIFGLKEDEEELYHHTYMEERKLLDCVREGNIQEALRYTRNMDVDLGKLSDNEISHWRNAAIVGITLCTRAAIEGGVAPSASYRLSDFYIQKCDKCSDIPQLLEYRNHAIRELTEQVHKRRNRKNTSSYVERCKDYVNQHYREKIYLEDIAETLGIGASYVSRLFRMQMNMTLQDYVVQVRMEHAINLLVYSEETLAGIAEYVGFPSQSYMGKVFKKYKGITPRAYREQHKPREFTSMTHAMSK